MFYPSGRKLWPVLLNLKFLYFRQETVLFNLFIYKFQAGSGHKKSPFQSFGALLRRVAKFNVGQIDWTPHIPWVSRTNLEIHLKTDSIITGTIGIPLSKTDSMITGTPGIFPTLNWQNIDHRCSLWF